MADIRFTKTHEYIKPADGAYTVGISDHAQGELGDITFVELPAPGTEIAAGEVCCTVESVKAVAEVNAPVTLTVVAANGALEDTPELVNSDPYGEGWMINVEVKDPAELEQLMNEAAYTAMEK